MMEPQDTLISLIFIHWDNDEHCSFVGKISLHQIRKQKTGKIFFSSFFKVVSTSTHPGVPNHFHRENDSFNGSFLTVLVSLQKNKRSSGLEGLRSQRDVSQRFLKLHDRNVLEKTRMCWPEAAFLLRLCEVIAEFGD